MADWQPIAGDLPEGCLRGWYVIGGTGPLVGLFEVIDPSRGRSYMIAYRMKGTPRAIIEKGFATVAEAMSRGESLMSERTLEPYH